MPTELLTVAEAAQRLKLSRSFLDKRRIKGDGPTFSRIGRSIRYRAEDLDAWARSQSHSSTSEYEVRT